MACLVIVFLGQPAEGGFPILRHVFFRVLIGFVALDVIEVKVPGATTRNAQIQAHLF